MEVVTIVDGKVIRRIVSYDVLFKSLFIGNENILAKMISDITGIEYELLKDNIILETNELPINKKMINLKDVILF